MTYIETASAFFTTKYDICVWMQIPCRKLISLILFCSDCSQFQNAEFQTLHVLQKRLETNLNKPVNLISQLKYVKEQAFRPSP